MAKKPIQTGDIIYNYSIDLIFSKNTAGKSKTANKVLGINAGRLVIDDYSFTTLDLKKESYNLNPVVNKATFYESNYSWEKSVHAYIYSTNANEEKAYKKLKADFEKWLTQKCLFYGVGAVLLQNLK